MLDVCVGVEALVLSLLFWPLGLSCQGLRVPAEIARLFADLWRGERQVIEVK